MITDLSIQNYRGIARAELAGLRRFSVLTGANNAGKSTVLEAMAMLETMGAPQHPNAARILRSVFSHRQAGSDIKDSLRIDRAGSTLILSGSDDRAVEFFEENDELRVRGKQFTLPVPNNPELLTFARTSHVTFVAAPASAGASGLEKLWSFAVKTGYSHAVLEAAKRLDPSIVNLQLVMEGSGAALYAESDIGGPRRIAWPVAAGGSGFKRLLSLAAQVSGASGLICLDDPDVFLYPKAFGQLASLLWTRVRDGAQVVVATHNPELIDALAKDLTGPPDTESFGAYSLVREPSGKVTSTLRMTGQSAQTARRRVDIRAMLGLS